MSWASTRANAARARSPPDSDGTVRSARCDTSVAAIDSTTRRSSSASSGWPAHGARPISTIWRTVKGNDMVTCCSRTARRMAISTALHEPTGSPSISTSPRSGCRSPASTDSSVDLPAPLGPTSASR